MQNLNALYGVAYRERQRFSVPQLGYLGYQNIRLRQSAASGGVPHMPKSALTRYSRDTKAQLELCRQAVAAARTVVCRLIAGVETMRQRVKMRESGMLQGEFVARVEELNGVLERAQLEDFIVENENRSLTSVALEVLVKAGLISN